MAQKSIIVTTCEDSETSSIIPSYPRNRVVGLGRVILGSSSVRSRIMEGGCSPGLRKWLMVSKLSRKLIRGGVSAR